MALFLAGNIFSAVGEILGYIKEAWTVLVDIFTGMATLVELAIYSLGAVLSSVIFLPEIIAAFVIAIVAVSVVYLIIGR